MAKRNGTTRRQFLGRGAVATCGAFAASQFGVANAMVGRAMRGDLTADERYQLGLPENTLYTSCLNCNTGCGIKVKVLGGVAAKIDGSPYNPFSASPHLPMSTDLAMAATADTAICPKGQALHQGAYDPYRIRKVLKRAGRRGEGKWISVPFAQAVDEIVNGGTLFAGVPGEANRVVTGLRDLYALKDKPVMDAMGVDVAAIRKKTMTVAAFKEKWAAHLDKLIDPEHPDFGPRNNQFVYLWGRKKGGRSDFSKRFYEAFGTANFHGHTTVCQGSLYFACKAISEQYDGASFSGGQKFYWQADLEHAEYVLFVGANLFDANYGPSNRTPRMTQRLADGTLEIAVVDPRCTKLASKANGAWIPVKPGTDGAFAMGVTRWILENRRYDATFLANANKAAATIDREPSWCNASWLVKVGADGKPGAFVRGSEVGFPKETRTDPVTAAITQFDFVVVSQGGVLVPVDPNSTTSPVEGDLFVDTEVATANGPVRLKSSLQLMLEAAQERSIPEWAAICGIDAGFIEEVAFKLTSHGKRAAVDVHRGPAQHTNGFYAISALMNLNMLIGNFDWAGGMMAFSAYNYDGTKTTAQPFNLSKLKPATGKAFGLSIIRHDAKYEESTIFSGYPAKRNWWPLSSDVYQEVLPSAADAYPYPIKALFSYMAAPTYSLPAGHTQIQALLDVEKIPLYFASDIIIGPTTQYADYIFPDLHSLERWEMQGSHPNMPVKLQPVRQPVIGSPNELVTVFGEAQPISYETLWMALAEKLGVPGFGPDGFGAGQPLNRPDDFYVRCLANLAMDGTPVADATDEDLRIFTQSRVHLPLNVYDPARWEAIAGPAWRKVVTLLTRGGRFDAAENAFKVDQVANKYAKMLCLYQEKTAKVKDAFTGKAYRGLGGWVPVVDTLDRTPADGGCDLQLITQKDVRMCKSRTITQPYLNRHMPENAVIVSATDAQRLGLASGQLVKVASSTNPAGEWDLGAGNVKGMIGRVQVTEGIRPGVVTFTIGHGMFGNGATQFTVDGHRIRPDEARQGGLNANAAMWVDTNLGNTCLIDKVGGSVSFYDTMVRLIPVSG